MSGKRILVISGDSRLSAVVLSGLVEAAIEVVRVDVSSELFGTRPDRVIYDDLLADGPMRTAAMCRSPAMVYGPERNYRKGKSRRW